MKIERFLLNPKKKMSSVVLMLLDKIHEHLETMLAVNNAFSDLKYVTNSSNNFIKASFFKFTNQKA